MESISSHCDAPLQNLALVSWTLGIKELSALMDKVREHGLTALWYAGDHRDFSAEKTREAAEEKGVRLVAVDPWNCKPANAELASVEGAIAYYRDLIRFAEALGHVPVTLQGLSQWTRNCRTRSEAIERLLHTCRAVATIAEDRKVPLLYEVANQYEVPLIHTSEECANLLDAIGSDNVGITLDAFHMNINEPSSTRAMTQNASRLKAYHISDSGRGGIGSGQVDFSAQYNTLRAVKFDGIIAIELVLPELTPDTPPSTDEDRQRLDAEIRRSIELWRAIKIRC